MNRQLLQLSLRVLRDLCNYLLPQITKDNFIHTEKRTKPEDLPQQLSDYKSELEKREVYEGEREKTWSKMQQKATHVPFQNPQLFDCM